MLFWVLRDVISVAMGWESIEPHDIVWSALTSTITAAVMYGSAVFIALKGRATQIEEKAWRDGSAKCLIPIALKAGLVTWGVIVAATLISYQFPQIWHSLIAMVQGLKSFVGGTPADAATEGWSFLPIKIVYPVHVMTRKSFGLMMRKLSVTESQKSAQFPGTFSRRKLSVASANWAQVA